MRLHKGAFRGLGGSPGETFHGQTFSLQNLELKWVNPSEVQLWTPAGPEGIAGNTAPPPPFHPRHPHPPSSRPCGREGSSPPAIGALRCPRGSRASLGAVRRAGRRGRSGGFPAARAVLDPRPGQAGGLRNTPAKPGAPTELSWGLLFPKTQNTSAPCPPPSPSQGENPTRGGNPAAAPRARSEAGAVLSGRPAPLAEGSALSAAVWAGEQPGVRRGEPSGLGPSPAGWSRAPYGAERSGGAPTGAPVPRRRRRCPARPGPLTPGCGCHLPAERGQAPPAAPGLPRAPPAAAGAAELRRERLLPRIPSTDRDGPGHLRHGRPLPLPA